MMALEFRHLAKPLKPGLQLLQLRLSTYAHPCAVKSVSTFICRLRTRMLLHFVVSLV